MQVDEFKTLVKELHKNGIEIILDVVFNHTAEGNERGPTISFRGFDNKTYYMLTPEGYYFNFCGTRQHAQLQQPDRAQHGARLPALLGGGISRRRVPVRSGGDSRSRSERRPAGSTRRCSKRWPSIRCSAKCKLIAEAWDAGGLYQVGSFPAYGRWAEWNGKYRDAVRKFIKGDEAWSARSPSACRARPISTAGRARRHGLDQLHHLPRRLYAARSGVVQRQAQRGQRREQQRRRQRQRELELRLGRRHRRSGDQRAPRPPDEERRWPS